jgi:hypothetical protein
VIARTRWMRSCLSFCSAQNVLNTNVADGSEKTESG